MKTPISGRYRPHFQALADLYGRMVAAYAAVAEPLGFTCAHCPRNCCTSHFQHHTYLEWAYLWQGLRELPEDRRRLYAERAEENARQAAALLGQGLQPGLMCPLNDDGRCGLYKHRLMICRLHGVPHRLAPPGRPAQAFPGCFRCQELVQAAGSEASMDRTPLYVELAALERRFLGAKAGRLPKVDLTLAQMIAIGPTRL